MCSSLCWRALAWPQSALSAHCQDKQKVSDIAFRAQVIATVTQICNLYWDLVAAYDTAQVSERSVDFAKRRWTRAAKQFELQAIPQMDVLKAQSDLATRNRT
jgi:outer membrane protein TolC